MCKQPSWSIDNSIVPPSRQPKTTTTTRQVTREVYDENGKLIEKVVETTTDTVTVDDTRPYVTWNGSGPIGTEVKYGKDAGMNVVDLRINGSSATVKEHLDLMDRDTNRR